jgi:hypothetical protein
MRASTMAPSPSARTVTPRRRPLGRLLNDQDWRLVGLIVPGLITRNVLGPNGIVSPGRQFGTALVSVGGSAGAPSAVACRRLRLGSCEVDPAPSPSSRPDHLGPPPYQRAHRLEEARAVGAQLVRNKVAWKIRPRRGRGALGEPGSHFRCSATMPASVSRAPTWPPLNSFAGDLCRRLWRSGTFQTEACASTNGNGRNSSPSTIPRKIDWNSVSPRGQAIARTVATSASQGWTTMEISEGFRSEGFEISLFWVRSRLIELRRELKAM